MDGPDRRQSASKVEMSSGQSHKAGRVLAVALSEEAVNGLPRHVLEPHSYIAKTQFDDMDTIVFTGPDAPDLVLSPLLTPIFDALDLARYLTQAGFAGRYLALVEKLPNAKLIRAEVEAQSPSLNFDIIVLDGTTPIHSL
jgi:hypothetical protein